MLIHILTLFPNMFDGPFQESIIKRAQSKSLHDGNPPLTLNVIDIRHFTTDKHHTADARPYGGGAGMVMKIEPIHKALQSIGVEKGQTDSKILLTSAKGRLFTQQVSREYSTLKQLVIICGHYEGVDHRVAEYLIDEEVRIGDYVLTGGEPAAIVMTDAIVRLLPGVLGNDQSIITESHSTPGYFEHPQYTRPEVYNGWAVPEVLRSGHHKEIEDWKKTTSQS